MVFTYNQYTVVERYYIPDNESCVVKNGDFAYKVERISFFPNYSTMVTRVGETKSNLIHGVHLIAKPFYHFDFTRPIGTAIQRTAKFFIFAFSSQKEEFAAELHIEVSCRYDSQDIELNEEINKNYRIIIYGNDINIGGLNNLRWYSENDFPTGMRFGPKDTFGMSIRDLPRDIETVGISYIGDNSIENIIRVDISDFSKRIWTYFDKDRSWM